MEPAPFTDQVAEDVILEAQVFIPARWATASLLAVECGRLLARRIVEPGRAKISDFELHRNPALLLIVLKRLGDKFQIAVEVGGKLTDCLLLQPAMQHFFLQRNIYLLVRVPM